MPLSGVPFLAEHFTVCREPVFGRHGVVATQHSLASQVGVEVLEAGGNAIDAAVAAAFALGVVEPWMSGIGGGGFLLYADASNGAVHEVDFGMVSPRGVEPDYFGLVEGTAGHDALFSWPRVIEDRNQIGACAIAVPGAVAGFAAAVEAFGTMPWSDLIAPAADLATRGLPVTWSATLEIAGAADTLRLFDTSRAMYLSDDMPPVANDAHRPIWLALGRLAGTYERLAKAGPRDFYEGEIANAIANDVRAAGGIMDHADLACYRAEIRPARAIGYRGAQIHLTEAFSGGPTFARALQHLARDFDPTLGLAPETYLAWADALFEAFDNRLAVMGHSGDLVSRDVCTTHLSVVDRWGNMAALTNTLVESFGSRVVLPETGILMNNGMFWFDPRRGRPNSLAPGVRPLANMCPVIATRAGKPWFALGASGGRRIVPAVFQLASLLCDFGLSLDQAYAVPRLDVSGEPGILADHRLDQSILAALGGRFDVTRTYDSVGMDEFAKPQAVLQENGNQYGAVATTVATALAIAARATDK
jgi:gamma-glutamyltranspeptidase/glutathione hydrolase